MDDYELWIFMAQNKVHLDYDKDKNNIIVKSGDETEIMDLNEDHAFMFAENILPVMLRLKSKLVLSGKLI